MPKAVSLLRLGGLDDDDERPRGAAESQTPADRVPLCWCSTAGCGTLMMIGPVLGHRVTFGTTEHKTLAGQLEECGRWHNETENAPVTVDRGGLEGSGGSKSEGAGDGPLQPPAGPSSGNTQSLMSLIVC